MIGIVAIAFAIGVLVGTWVGWLAARTVESEAATRERYRRWLIREAYTHRHETPPIYPPMMYP